MRSPSSAFASVANTVMRRPGKANPCCSSRSSALSITVTCSASAVTTNAWLCRSSPAEARQKMRKFAVNPRTLGLSCARTQRCEVGRPACGGARLCNLEQQRPEPRRRQSVHDGVVGVRRQPRFDPWPYRARHAGNLHVKTDHHEVTKVHEDHDPMCCTDPGFVFFV